MATILKRAIERHRRQKFLEDANASYAALKANRKEWNEEIAERELWDRTNGDGIANKSLRSPG